MRLLSYVSLLACTGMLAACTAILGDEDPPPSDVLMPLDVGNRWTYSVSERRVIVATETWEITRTVDMGGVRYAELVKTHTRLSNGRVTVDTTYLLNRPDGLWTGVKRNANTGSGGTFYAFPASPGTAFYNPLARMCVAHAEGVEVPAGTFGGLLFGRCDNFDAHLEFFSPNVGMVFSGNFDATFYGLGSFALQEE